METMEKKTDSAIVIDSIVAATENDIKEVQMNYSTQLERLQIWPRIFSYADCVLPYCTGHESNAYWVAFLAVENIK